MGSISTLEQRAALSKYLLAFEYCSEWIGSNRLVGEERKELLSLASRLRWRKRFSPGKN